MNDLIWQVDDKREKLKAQILTLTGSTCLLEAIEKFIDAKIEYELSLHKKDNHDG